MAVLQGPLKTLDSDCSKEEKQYAEWVTVRARVALLEACLCFVMVPASITTAVYQSSMALCAMAPADQVLPWSRRMQSSSSTQPPVRTPP